MRSYRIPHITSALLCSAALALSASPPARADIVTADPSLPPASGEYRTAADVHASYGGGAVVITDIRHFGFTNVSRIPLGADELEQFDSVLQGVVTVPVSTPILLQGPVATGVLGKVGNVTGTFTTELLSMNLSTGAVLIRESPTLASLGQTTIEDIGGGLFRISSFFDVFTELSLDGGQNFIPSDGATRVTLVPEPGTLVLAGFGAALLAARRRAGRAG